MRDDCIRAVEAELKRPITKAEAIDIEGRVNSAIVQGQKKDPIAWRGLTRAERITEGGKLAAQELQAEAAKKKQRLGEAIMLKAWNDRYLNSQVASGADTGPDAKLKSLDRMLSPHYDGKSNVVSVEETANGYFSDGVRKLEAVFDTIKPGLFKNLPWDQPEIQSQMRRALAGITQGIEPEFVKAAKAFHDVAEEFRVQFNAAGGVIGKLVNWDQPHSWASRLANKFGEDQFVQDFKGWLDRSQYVHENGTRWTDGDVEDFLKEAWRTIVSGVSKESGSRPGGSMKANRHGAHREIHLLPEHTETALKKYSERAVMEAMTGHLRQMSRDVALVQRFGPSADAQFKAIVDETLQEVRTNDPGAMSKARARAYFLQKLYDHLAGNEEQPPSRALADTLGAYRTLKSGAVLGKAVITSVTDHATMWNAAISGGLNPFKVELNTAMAWAPKSRRFIKRMGLMTDTLVGEAQRFGTENLTARDMGSRVSSFMMRRSGLNLLTELRRAGYAVTMMDAIGRMTRRNADIHNLHPNDTRILMGKGIDQATWNIWRAARLDKHGANHTLLTPDGIMGVNGPSVDAKRRAIATLLGVTQAETDLAVITPGAREKVQMTAGTQAGTVGGELMRSAVLFKSFPWTFVQRHLERARTYDSTFGRAAYVGSLMITTTLLGAVAQTIADMVDGKNPPDFNPQSEHGIANWTAAMLKGGGLGIFGDFLFNEVNPTMGQGAGSYIGGPLASDIDTAGRIGSNLFQAATGNEPDNQGTTPLQKAGVKGVQLAKGLIPGSSLWYTKALTDRYIYNALLEQIDPNYLQAMKARQQSQQGTTYFADPDAQAGLDGSHWDRPDIGTAWAQ